MNLKSNSKLKVYVLSVISIIILGSGLYLYFQNIPSAPDTIETFLRKYYTVSTYITLPNEAKDVDELKGSYKDCLVEAEIERLIITRTILLNSLAAEQEGCTLKPKTIHIMPVDHESQVYTYEITVTATYNDNKQKDITLTGKVYMEDDSKDSLISKYFPDGEKQEIFNLLK